MTNYIGALIDELYLLGIKHVVISPGSRSTPLSMIFMEGDFKTYINIDERSAGFFALGIAKELGEPVILVCTSGTAACNYLPAVTEATASKIPLIVLTSDRPHELRNVGAPQSINQNNIYNNFVKHYEELALPKDDELYYRYARTVIDRSYSMAMALPKGVVHINVPLRDPLVPEFDKLDFTLGRRKHTYNFFESYNGNDYNLDVDFSKYQSGIIICGVDINQNYFDEVIALSEKLKVPILADPISNFRSRLSKNIIYTYDSILKNEEIYSELQVDYIIHFGDIFVSKPLNKFIRYNDNVRYIKVAPDFNYVSSTLSITDYIVAGEQSFCNSINYELKDCGYLDKWINLQSKYTKNIDDVVKEEAIVEGNIIKTMEKSMKEDTRFFVANSMSIRNVDSYFRDKYKKNIKILCNRGANGIDGIVSSALGVAQVADNTVLLIGDLSFYHDLNGLLVSQMEGADIVIVLINNGGGGIFRYLPQSQERNFEYLFLTKHGIDFSGLATLYNINYRLINDYEDFEISFKKAIESKGVNLLEVMIDSQESKRIHKMITEKC
ncbi:2-succinyl-5-enolpyruvyl-6-hydroxy-3-cyclohexene-1-carboxylic-acid synthase [Vallitalea guaymasensis]|uniref:2-succinyl-5-enolpyruvyl-6-hydroxy-3-cyclohexene-1-carboxylate synthase n=1 Tax=Vallitalea guaymasensis TaxID=1185412 RepID=A0A8J8MCV2_9FIRM|nr:2-succinyl-5-enolpyruvyl-6-hydroxy-3-cyclohexene-1-carboxylic-acid synthase [Vallitalea guaymasensis]QUH30463.1 2-succinyl-5-enolpyruvyl-6-hydroxy-3-cyclohexene-1-carboxylic-acid synthase [Vallitalea guaymasensis]